MKKKPNTLLPISSLLLIFSLLSCMSLIAEESLPLPADELLQESLKLEANHQAWLEEKPRKIAIQGLEKGELPAKLQELGFQAAAIETGLVIFYLSKEENKEIHLKGIAVSTHGNDPTKILSTAGWTVSDSQDQRIKLIQKLIQQ